MLNMNDEIFTKKLYFLEQQENEWLGCYLHF